MKSEKLIFLYLFFFLLRASASTPILCRNCGNQTAPAQSVNTQACPVCGSNKITLGVPPEKNKVGVIKLTLEYLGREPNFLPPYGRLYLNSRDLGKIERTGNHFVQTTEPLPVGVYHLRVRLRFFRWHGLMPTYRWLKFAHVGVRPGETTELIYQWRDHRQFGNERPFADDLTEKSFSPEIEP